MSDARYDPAFQRGYDAPEPIAAEPGLDAPRRRNGWLALLWVAGAVLLVLGVGPTLYYALTASGSYQLVTTGEQYFAASMLPILIREVSPWLVTSGIAAVVGAVFIHARDWRG